MHRARIPIHVLTDRLSRQWQAPFDEARAWLQGADVVILTHTDIADRQKSMLR